MAVSKQFNNRRENILINDIPPEILTEAELSAYGYVKNTDYPTSTKAGVIKAATSYGTTITPQGFLGAQTRTAEQYDQDANTMFIGKGTLENIFNPKVLAFLTALAAGYEASEVGTTWKTIVLEKTADGPVVTFEAIAPPETP